MSKGFGLRHLITRLLRDEEGSYLLYMTLAIPAFIGFSALATEGALIYYNHRTMHSAADAAAYSAAIAYSNNTTLLGCDLKTEAEAIFASYGFDIGTGNNQVNVDCPTIQSPYYTGNPNTAITVTATRPQLPLLSGIWAKSGFNVPGSAIAIVSGGAGPGNCLLAFGKRTVGGVTTTDAPEAIKIAGGGAP